MWITELTIEPPQTSKDSAPARGIQIPLCSWRPFQAGQLLLEASGPENLHPVAAWPRGPSAVTATLSPQLCFRPSLSARGSHGPCAAVLVIEHLSGWGPREGKNLADGFSRASDRPCPWVEPKTRDVEARTCQGSGQLSGPESNVGI